MPLEFEDALPDDPIYKDERVTVITKPELQPGKEVVIVMTNEEIEEELKHIAAIRAKYKKDPKS